MSEELLEFLKKNFGDLSQEQLMESFINHKISTSILLIAIMSILIGLCAMVIVLIVHDLKKNSHDPYEEEDRKIGIGVFAVIILLCTIVLCVNIGTIIKCKTFPEKAMYDSIKSENFWNEEITE